MSYRMMLHITMKIVFNNVGQPNMMMGTSMGKATLNKAKCHPNVEQKSLKLKKLKITRHPNIDKMHQIMKAKIHHHMQAKAKLNQVITPKGIAKR